MDRRQLLLTTFGSGMHTYPVRQHLSNILSMPVSKQQVCNCTAVAQKFGKVGSAQGA